jgi:tripartite-type tricarboxylate transporter receptor subunit TctC
MTRLFFIITALLACLSSTVSPAQDAWPSKPVKLVVPSSPGGGTDVFARLLAQSLSESMKQQFLVENRPGASGNIVLVVDASLGVKTLAEFIALAKTKPGGLAYGSAGTGTAPYLGVRKLEEAAGVSFLHAPYKGVGPAYQDLVGGRLQFMYTDVASVLPHIQSGKVVPLAVDGKTSLLPQVPTFADAGWPTFSAPISFSVMAPAGVPKPIVQRLSLELGNALRTLAPRLEQQGLVPVYDTPDAFAASLKAERANWSEFIQRQGITAEQ